MYHSVISNNTQGEIQIHTVNIHITNTYILRFPIRITYRTNRFVQRKKYNKMWDINPLLFTTISSLLFVCMTVRTAFVSHQWSNLRRYIPSGNIVCIENAMILSINFYPLKMEFRLKYKTIHIHLYFIVTLYFWKYALVEDIDN